MRAITKKANIELDAKHQATCSNVILKVTIFYEIYDEDATTPYQPLFFPISFKITVIFIRNFERKKNSSFGSRMTI